MFTLITGGSVYAPEKLGRKDILITGGVIARIADRIDLPEDFKPLIFRAKGRKIEPGLVHLHMGAGSRRLDPLIRMVKETEIPIGQLLPTHLNRTRVLMQHAIEFAKMGGNIDITASGRDLHFDPIIVEAVRMALAAGVSVDQISISSDSNGSMPIFDTKDDVVKLGVGDIQCLFETWLLLVKSGVSMLR
jgi:beta-aspartyl-dipeptidase (metallo-type)